MLRLTASVRRTDPLLEVAMELEKVAMSDEYFIQRGIWTHQNRCC